MNRSTRRRRRPPRTGVKRASALAATLPTREQIAEAKSDLDAVIAFFQQRRHYLDTLPAADNDDPGTNNQVFDRLFDHAKTNPALALAVGVAPNLAASSGSASDSTDEQRRARELCDLINNWI